MNKCQQPQRKIIEAQVEAHLVRRVTALGGIAEKVASMSSRGFFDRLVVLPGPRILFLELKRPKGGTVSKHQILCHAKYRALGCEVHVIKNAGDVDRVLDGAN
jgi:hypothetical protein